MPKEGRGQRAWGSGGFWCVSFLTIATRVRVWPWLLVRLTFGLGHGIEARPILLHVLRRDAMHMLASASA